MKYVKRYCDKILGEEIRSCEEQKQLCRLVLRAFEEEDIHIDELSVDKYFGLQKYFRYELFDWEKFCFVLHCCTYRADGMPRWPDMLGYMGRGSGKNGYVSFEDFALLSPANGIRNYNIQSFAAAEDNAKTSFEEVRNDVLEEHKPKLSRFYSWNMEKITCTKTKSVWTYHTSAPKTKDGGRPGKVNFDEIHVFENSDLIDVAEGGLGKVRDPRKLYTSTDGEVRDGVLDAKKEAARAILRGDRPDNGFLPFMCHLELSEIDDPDNWIMAVPSLDEFPVLREQMMRDYIEYKEDPIRKRAFAVKRCNCPDGVREGAVTGWENIQACCRGAMPSEIPEVLKRPCVIAVDYSLVDDFMSAVIVNLIDGIYYVRQKTWICEQSRDLPRINFPYMEAVARGEAEMVKGSEIGSELPFLWIKEETKNQRVLAGAADSYRFPYMKRNAEQILGITGEARKAANHYGEDTGHIYFTRPSDLAKAAPDITLDLNRRMFYCGDSMIMRWYLNNVKRVVDIKGNTTFEKIEGKSRKTDGAMALFAAMTVAPMLEKYDKKKSSGIVLPKLKIYR